MNNHFLSSTQPQSNNIHFYYVCKVYWNTFNRACTGLTVYGHVLSVTCIPNLCTCSFFQNLKIVTHLLTKIEHFHLL
jgi:hypothetical protein